MIAFDGCHSPAKVMRLMPYLPATLLAIRKIAFEANWIRASRPWPTMVYCMSRKEIRVDKQRGKGHGLYTPSSMVIKINRTMPWRGIYLNLVHELFHYTNQHLSDTTINNKYVPMVYRMVFGKPLRKPSWRQWRGTNPCAKC